MKKSKFIWIWIASLPMFAVAYLSGVGWLPSLAYYCAYSGIFTWLQKIMIDC